MITHQFTKDGLERKIRRLEANLSNAMDYENALEIERELTAHQNALYHGYAFHNDFRIALGVSNVLLTEKGDVLGKL